METNLPGNFQELITNSYFVEWVKNPTPESEQFWQQFLEKNSSIKIEFDKARYVVKTLQKRKKVIDEDNVLEIWNSIQSRLDQKSKKFNLFDSWKAAATIILVLGLAFIFYLKFERQEIDFSKIAIVQTDVNDVTLILSDGLQKVFYAKQPSFSYLHSGVITGDF